MLANRCLKRPLRCGTYPSMIRPYSQTCPGSAALVLSNTKFRASAISQKRIWCETVSNLKVVRCGIETFVRRFP